MKKTDEEQQEHKLTQREERGDVDQRGRPAWSGSFLTSVYQEKQHNSMFNSIRFYELSSQNCRCNVT